MPQIDARDSQRLRDLLAGMTPHQRDVWLSAGYHLLSARPGTGFRCIVMDNGTYMDDPYSLEQEGDSAA